MEMKMKIIYVRGLHVLGYTRAQGIVMSVCRTQEGVGIGILVTLGDMGTMRCTCLSRFQIWKPHMCTCPNQVTNYKILSESRQWKFDITQITSFIYQMNQIFKGNPDLKSVFCAEALLHLLGPGMRMSLYNFTRMVCM